MRTQILSTTDKYFDDSTLNPAVQLSTKEYDQTLHEDLPGTSVAKRCETAHRKNFLISLKNGFNKVSATSSTFNS